MRTTHFPALSTPGSGVLHSDSGSPETSALLTVSGLRVEYRTDEGVTTAVGDVGFSMRAGERIAIVGESGSGKTATCLAIAGFLTHPAVSVAGSVTFSGKEFEIADRPRLPPRVPGIAMIFQDAMTSLDPLWTVGSQLGAVLRNTGGIRGTKARALSSQWLQRVGIDDVDRVLKSRPGELSGGMRQRVMIALALAGGPKLVIADEPTSALDAVLARNAMELLVRLTTEEGIGLIIVSHDIHLCQRFCDRILVMYGGSLVEAGNAEVLSHRSRHPYTQGLLQSVPTLAKALEDDRLPTIPESPTGDRFSLTGCVFQNRCPLRIDKCSSPPPMASIGANHDSACWRAIPGTPEFIEMQAAPDGTGLTIPGGLD